MIKQAYINGFMRKCAQRGVDGRKLMRRVLTKRAQGAAFDEFDPERFRGNTVANSDLVKDYADRVNEEREKEEREENKQIASYVNTHLPQDIHQPITASNVVNAVTNFPDYHDEGQMPAMPMAGNMILQRYIDAMPNPGPGVRNPTPYELMDFYRALMSSPARGKNGVMSRLDSAFGPVISLLPKDREDGDSIIDDINDRMVPSLFSADPRLQNEAIRRSWNAATSAVPISVTSPTR